MFWTSLKQMDKLLSKDNKFLFAANHEFRETTAFRQKSYHWMKILFFTYFFLIANSLRLGTLFSDVKRLESEITHQNSNNIYVSIYFRLESQ